MRSSRLVLALVAATTIGAGLFTYQQNVVASAATVTVSGTLYIIQGDPKPGSSQPARTRYSLAGESGEWNLKSAMPSLPRRAARERSIASAWTSPPCTMRRTTGPRCAICWASRCSCTNGFPGIPAPDL